MFEDDGYSESFTYDPVGNMVEKVLNGTKIAMTYDAANELKTMESPHGKLTYIYDLNGNLTRKTLGDRTDTYSYDARNRLKQYRGYDNYQVKYSYNALGMLHARESSGNHSRTTLEELIAGKEDSDDPDGNDGSHITTYTYDLTQPYYQVLTETTDGATTAYTYGLERLAAYTENTRTAYLYDGRGSVIQTRGSLGTQTMAYSAYGELLTEKTSGYGYNGEYYDAATGMLNLRARQYEPAQARFCQYDPLRGSVFAPQSLNRYLYCWNDPVDIIDPSGKLGILGILAIGALVGGVIGGAASIIEQKSQGQKINWGEVGRSAAGGATAGLAITAGGLTGGVAGAAAISTVELIAGTRTALTGGSVADVLQSAGTGGGAAAIGAAVAPAVPATVKEIIGASGAVRSSAKLYDDYRTAKKTLNDPLAKGNDKAVAVLDVATDTLALAGSITLVQQNLKPSVSELKQASSRVRQTTNTNKQTYAPQKTPSESTQIGGQAAGCRKVFTQGEVNDLADRAMKGPLGSNVVVLGKNIDNSADSYQEVAKRMDAQYFDLENWNELRLTYSSDEMWRINEEFLTRQLDSGKEILLTSDPYEYLGDISGYGNELQYLDDHGYTFVKIGENLWRAIKGN